MKPYENETNDDQFDFSGIILISQTLIIGIAMSFLVFFAETTYYKKKNKEKKLQKINYSTTTRFLKTITINQEKKMWNLIFPFQTLFPDKVSEIDCFLILILEVKNENRLGIQLLLYKHLIKVNVAYAKAIRKKCVTQKYLIT